MKVDVLQVEEVEIKKWRWWSNWIDICVFDYAGEGYLLQMKISRINSKKFKAIGFAPWYGVAHAHTLQAGDLTMSRTDKTGGTR